MLKLNYELSKKIQEIVASNPNADEDFVVDKIVNANTLRMKKESVKSGVKEFFKNKIVKVDSDKKSPPTTLPEISNPKKKVKKGELEFQFEDNPFYKFENMGGVQQVLTQIKNTIFVPIERSKQVSKLGTELFKGFLLTGPIGSGKTFLSNCILSHMKNVLNFNTYYVHSGSLTSSDAEENLKKLFQTAKQNEPSVVLIDDIDILCSKQSSKRPQGSPAIALAIQIDKLRQYNIYIIATSSNPQKLDIPLKKLNRFDKTFSINISNDDSRQKILKKLLITTNNNLTEEQISQVAKLTSGFMAADLVMLIKQAGLQALLSTKNEPILTAETIMKSLKHVQPLMKKEGFTDIPSVTLDDVGGLKNLKLQLEREIIIPIRQQAKFRQMNFEVQSGGVLLYGPPGCGKTMLAKAIANAVKANFIIVKGPQLLNKYVGESQQAVREVFGRAQRASPCVIFFDQFDALAPKRSDQGNQVTQRVVNTLLTALDGVEERKMVFVIAATNRKDMIDQATLRAGRIQKHLYVPQPTEEERIQILKAITKRISIDKNVKFRQIASKGKGFSGADLKFIVKQAAVSAVMDNRKEVSQQDLNKALEQVLQAKAQHKQTDIVHEIELKDDEQNQKYAYHYQPQKERVQVEKIEKNKEKSSSSDLMEQFMKFLSYKLNKK